MHPTRVGLQCWMANHRWGPMVPRGGNSPYKLSWVASNLSSNKSIWKGMVECHRFAANGQCYHYKLHQSEREDSLTTTVSVNPDNLDLVCWKEYNSPSRASFRSPEPASLLGILHQPIGLLPLGIFFMIIILDHTTLFFTLIVNRTDLVSNIIC